MMGLCAAGVGGMLGLGLMNPTGQRTKEHGARVGRTSVRAPFNLSL